MSVELPESIINGRFKYLERPAALPGKCAVCGRVDVPVLDFGLDVDYFGAVVICVDDIRAALQVADLYETSAPAPVVPPIAYLDIEAVNEYVARANASLGALNSVLATISRPSMVDAKSAEEPPTLFDAAESEPVDLITAEPTVSSGEGPLAYQQISAMNQTSLQTSNVYVSMDDASEAERWAALVGDQNLGEDDYDSIDGQFADELRDAPTATYDG